MLSRQHRSTRMLAAILAALSFSAVSCGPKLTTGPGVVDPDAPTEFTTTESGLKYRILRKGKGDYPTASSQVVVDYAGTLEDGTTFDTSYNHSEPATFGLRSVVPGWTEGMQLVREGGMIELQIPPDLAYGEEGSPPIIPPNATLMFRVELLDIL